LLDLLDFELFIGTSEAFMTRCGTRGLSPKQQRFVEEYLIDLNATQAAIRAGYSEKTAQPASSRLLSNVMVQAAIQEAMRARSERTQITADSVLKELALVGFSSIGNVLDFSGQMVRLRAAKDISEEAQRALASMKVKRHVESNGDDAKEVEILEFRMCDKISALEKLGRHLKLFTDVHEHQGAISANVQTDKEFLDAVLADPELSALACEFHERIARLQDVGHGQKAEMQTGSASPATLVG
jgi:phage terminase small subunit